MTDELDEYLATALKDPRFKRAFCRAGWDGLWTQPAEVRARLYMLLTWSNVTVEDPVIFLPKVQPVGALIDAYLCRPGHEATWQEAWSRVTDTEGAVIKGRAKGYAEVEW